MEFDLCPIMAAFLALAEDCAICDVDNITVSPVRYWHLGCLYPVDTAVLTERARRPWHRWFSAINTGYISVIAHLYWNTQTSTSVHY